MTGLTLFCVALYASMCGHYRLWLPGDAADARAERVGLTLSVPKGWVIEEHRSPVTIQDPLAKEWVGVRVSITRESLEDSVFRMLGPRALVDALPASTVEEARAPIQVLTTGPFSGSNESGRSVHYVTALEDGPLLVSVHLWWNEYAELFGIPSSEQLHRWFVPYLEGIRPLPPPRLGMP